MYSPYLILSFCILNVFFSDPALKYSPAPQAKIANSLTTYPLTTAGAANIIFQSKNGGRTWEDISYSLPENELPEDFFADESDLYLRIKGAIYHSKNNLKIPVWKKKNDLDPEVPIALHRPRVVAYTYDGKIYERMPDAGIWLPIFSNQKIHSMRTIFEASDGTVFLEDVNGFYKSTDGGLSCKKVHSEGWITNIVESEGVLIGTGQKGIIRSTDGGEHWEWVISHGGVGIAVERIIGGFAAISYSTITKSRRISISLDSGKSWKTIDEGLRPSPFISSVKQIGIHLICGHPDGIFRSSDLGKTWNMVHPAVDKHALIYNTTLNLTDSSNNPGKVFKVYVSGSVLYAVEGNAGC